MMSDPERELADITFAIESVESSLEERAVRQQLDKSDVRTCRQPRRLRQKDLRCERLTQCREPHAYTKRALGNPVDDLHELRLFLLRPILRIAFRVVVDRHTVRTTKVAKLLRGHVPDAHDVRHGNHLASRNC